MNINNVPTSGGSYTIDYEFTDHIYDGRVLTVEVDSSCSSWLGANADLNNHKIYVTVSPNEESNSRSCNIVPKVGGYYCNSNMIIVNQNGTHSPTSEFGKMLNEFNEVLSAYNKTQVPTDSSTATYLEDMYDAAVTEYNSGSLLRNSTYTDMEVFNWHGSNTTYQNEARSAMTSWIMAMCLTEIYAEKVEGNVTDNVQTGLFKKAYEIGGGREIPLYGKYSDTAGASTYFSCNSDVTLARLAAGAVFCKKRSLRNVDTADRWTFGQIAAFRSQLNSSTIENTNLLLSLTTSGKRITNLGCAVDAHVIFPEAAGPFLDSEINTGRTYPPEQTAKTQNVSDLFDVTGTNETNYNYYNYLVDKKIDDIVHSDYNLTTGCSANSARTVQAIADAQDQIDIVFANNVYYKYDYVNGCCNNSFYGSNKGSAEGYLKGTFNVDVTGRDMSDLMKQSVPKGKAFDNGLDYPSWMVESVRDVLLVPNYGRVRPGEGKGTDGDLRSYSDAYRNVLKDKTISSLVNGYTTYDRNGEPVYMYYDSNKNGEYNTGEDKVDVEARCYTTSDAESVYANTYPSGHSARQWARGMILTMMLPEKYVDIYKAAYKYTVSRTIIRYHWNSDTLYGKLIATMHLPVLLAIEGFNHSQSLKGNDHNLIDEMKYAQTTLDNLMYMVVKADNSNNILLSNEKFSGRFRLKFTDGTFVECYWLGNGERTCGSGFGNTSYDFSRLLFVKQSDVDKITAWRYLSFSRGCAVDAQGNRNTNAYIEPQFDTDLGDGCNTSSATCLTIGPYFQAGINYIMQNFVGQKTLAETGHIVYVFRNDVNQDIAFPAALTAMHWYDDSSHAEHSPRAYEEIHNGRKFINGLGNLKRVRYTLTINGRPS